MVATRHRALDRCRPAFIEDEPVHAEPFDAVEISMTPWWLPPDPDDQPR